MPKQVQITVSPREAAVTELLEKIVAREAGCRSGDIAKLNILRRSVDARKRRQVKVLLHVEIFLHGEEIIRPLYGFRFENVCSRPEVVIAGTGPAGLFAAFRLIERGFRPVLIERGRDVGNRKRDIALLCRGEGLNPESNYCFGEGGAGTFSDGKLFTRSRKRGDIERVLQLFHFHGAGDDILIDAHPHIGTDVLPAVIRNMRQTIIQCGGEFHFGQKLTDLIIRNGKVSGITTASGDRFEGRAVALATGHSATDVYEMFRRNGYLLEPKAFAVGVRVEHPQELINGIQYHDSPEAKYLPAAAYALTSQVDGRGVYSFCMCPGGYIVPASSSADGQVVNGMSSSRRHTAFANSGMVVEIRMEDTGAFARHGVLAGLRFRQHIEMLAAQNGRPDQIAPAQRIVDFVKGQASANFPACSYLPGIVSSPLHSWLPAQISRRLQEAFKMFDRKMQGFLTSESVIVGVESRSSTPVRIPRDAATMQHPQLPGLYPCGEGSGYAGGITSSAMDGVKVAERL
ncbi:MAG: FAD-binding protein [Bacteroidales bacterium]|jgi:uncharacterized FAD-dependent dehydrogenase|nr:FAD-binding protein [Bacteroidales bacterium]